MIAYAKFNGFLNVGYIINGFKRILRFRCHCLLIEYRTVPLRRRASHGTHPMSFKANITYLISLESGEAKYYARFYIIK